MEHLFEKIKNVNDINFENQEYKVKKVTLFDYLNDICFLKTGNIPAQGDYEMKVWNSFMILRYLSLDENLLHIINVFNEFQSCLTSKQLYKSLVLIIPRGRKYLKYPKLQETIFQDEEVSLLKRYFECSSKEILEYLKLGLISQKEIDIIKNKYGGKDEEASLSRGNNKKEY